jgi:aminopeptidase N
MVDLNNLDRGRLCESEKYKYDRLKQEYQQYCSGTLMISHLDANGQRFPLVHIMQVFMTIIVKQN